MTGKIGLQQQLYDLTGIDRPIDEVIFTGRSQIKNIYQVRNILLIANPYLSYTLEEEAQLSVLFRNAFPKKGWGYVPTVLYSNSAYDALEIMKEKNIDLLVIFNDPPDSSLTDLVVSAKECQKDINIAYMANNTPELARLADTKALDIMDGVFVWTGEASVFVNIVQYVEDKRTLEKLEDNEKQIILLIENDIAVQTKYVKMIYQVIWENTERSMKDHHTEKAKLLRHLRRPRLVIARSTIEAEKIIRRDISRVVLSVNDIELMDHSKIEEINSSKETMDAYLDRCIFLSEGTSMIDPSIQTLDKLEPAHLSFFLRKVKEIIGLRELRIVDEKKTVIANDLRSFETMMCSISSQALLTSLKNSQLSNWLFFRTEYELAEKFEKISKMDIDQELYRDKLLESIRLSKDQEINLDLFDQDLSEQDLDRTFVRIGQGSLGGKGRGLAFIRKIIHSYVNEDNFKGISIFIPKTLILCTDIFDSFRKINDIERFYEASESDERIRKEFLKLELPPTILGKLRDFLQHSRNPLMVRSSSMLEDALYQPFAGVYESFALSNSSQDIDERFKELCDAVKLVYASVFQKRARDYIRTTPNTIEDEKMGVVIQEVYGNRYEGRYYPNVSGVLRSFNYYPVQRCSSSDGVANLALGLGKNIVDGGSSFRFCPAKPRIPHYNSNKELMDNTQKTFFAVDLSERNVSRAAKDGCYGSYDISGSMKDGTLTHIASTYSPENDRLYMGTFREGPKVIDFARLIEERSYVIPKFLDYIMRLCELALGCPVEIEFAMNLDKKDLLPIEMAFLQVRSMVSNSSGKHADLDDIEDDRILLRSSRALGDGIWPKYEDIIYVKADSFDLVKTKEILNEISIMNKKMMDMEKKYILIGPGRWGSQDPFLGIPVDWGDISAAGVIVETPVQERAIDPSEGSHFFHNLTSAKIPYFTLSKKDFERSDIDWLSNFQPAEQTQYLVHVKLPEPAKVIVNGIDNEGVILKQRTSGEEEKGPNGPNEEKEVVE